MFAVACLLCGICAPISVQQVEYPAISYRSEREHINVHDDVTRSTGNGSCAVVRIRAVLHRRTVRTLIGQIGELILVSGPFPGNVSIETDAMRPVRHEAEQRTGKYFVSLGECLMK